MHAEHSSKAHEVAGLRAVVFVLCLGSNWCPQHCAALLSLQRKLEVGVEVVSSTGNKGVIPERVEP